MTASIRGGFTCAAIPFAQAITLDAGNSPSGVYADVIREFTPQEPADVAIVATAMAG
jgi:hypothetical protein